MTRSSSETAAPPPFDLDGRTFRAVSNVDGEVGAETRFHYHQTGDRVWATYAGGTIRFGTLIAVMAADGSLDMRYQHTDLAGAFRTGECQSTPEVLADGRIRYHESWRWTSGREGTGTSIVEEVERGGAAREGAIPGTPAMPPPRTPAMPPPRTPLSGASITLDPLDPVRDAADLFEAARDTTDPDQWTWMSFGPFADLAGMQDWLKQCAAAPEQVWFAVRRHADGRAVGMTSYLNVVPAMGRLEVGSIWLCSEAQRTPVLTEMIHLMLVGAFDRLGYRRVEWKCDARNRRSRAAARRLGFSFEGTFLNHMVVKGRSRDTAWYAVTDTEWPAVRANFETWLADPERSPSLRAMNLTQLRPGPVDDD